jgi:hypothetical protein
MATATMAPSRKGLGYTITKKGYKRITKGLHRHQYAHRLKAKQCMEASGKVLTLDFEVDHLCGNKECDADFHLLILPGVLHDLNNCNGKGRKFAP